MKEKMHLAAAPTLGTPIGIWMPAVRVAASGARDPPLRSVDGAKPCAPAASSSASDAIFGGGDAVRKRSSTDRRRRRSRRSLCPIEGGRASEPVHVQVGSYPTLYLLLHSSAVAARQSQRRGFFLYKVTIATDCGCAGTLHPAASWPCCGSLRWVWTHDPVMSAMCSLKPSAPSVVSRGGARPSELCLESRPLFEAERLRPRARAARLQAVGQRIR